jgi:hypothetical protein
LRRRLRLLASLPLLVAAARAPAAEAPAEPTLAVPAVPYLPQSEALCGGAALAMVMRYWGTADVFPADFRSALTSDGRGIPAEAMVSLAEARGFRAFAFHAEPADVAEHLSKGRPLIALVATAHGGHHYVVLLAWANGRVLVHDPARGPFRVIEETEWRRDWTDTGNWALLVLPAEVPVPATKDDAPEPAPTLAPLVEQAAVEFKAQRWAAAAGLARQAAQRDPEDAFAWRLLASSRFLAGDREGALRAWNHVGELRVDLVQINGLERTPFRAVDAYLGVGSGALLTPEVVRRARRRIESLDAVQASRVDYRPVGAGRGHLEVAAVERPAVTPWRSVLLRAAVGAAAEQAIRADLLGLARSGDTLHLLGHWQPHRAGAELTASAPRALGLPGIVTVEALWDEQSYRMSAEAAVMRERRRRVALSVDDWVAADTRLRLSVAGDEWEGTGSRGSFSADGEQRLLRDHVSIGGGAAGWWLDAPFYAARMRMAARAHAADDRTQLKASTSFDVASARAPLALWAGAGTGAGRPLMLRAHPLIHDGVVDGAAFGRGLWSASVQAERRVGRFGPIAIRAVGFVDAAAVTAPLRRPTQVDVGTGVRLGHPGARSTVRIDVATPWGRLQPRLSAGWEAAWPGY